MDSDSEKIAVEAGYLCSLLRQTSQNLSKLSSTSDKAWTQAHFLSIHLNIKNLDIYVNILSLASYSQLNEVGLS